MYNFFFQLQDLAVIPSLRDPRLNSAESVIEGHIPDIETAGRSYLKAVLWFSLLCPVFLGPFLYILVLQELKDSTKAGSDGKCSRLDDICCQKTDEPLIWSITFFCLFLLVIEFIFVLYKVFNSTEISKGGSTWHNFFVLLVLIPEWIIICRLKCLCCLDLVIPSFSSRLLLIICTSCVSYHLSWVAIGIMVNPAWGVSILLILSFFCITLFFVINETTHANDSRLSTLFAYTPGFLGLCFVVVPPVLVGQSFYGRETADDILKAALLSVIGSMSWLYFKSDKASSDASQCVKAAEKAAAAAKALAEKITVTEGDETEVHSAIVAAATATSSAAFAAAAAAKAVVDALPAAENENPLCEIQSASGR